MTRKTAALAVFVKTPGLSPIKTRLAAGLGTQKSENFYKLSVAAVAATVADVVRSTGAHPYWAVAEEQGMSHPLWQQFPRLWQGDGGLGSRIARIFDELQQQYSVVVAVGADAPQLKSATLITTLLKLLDSRSHIAHVVGRSFDGGFYLVGSMKQISRTTWADVTYSSDSTAEQLVENLKLTGEILELNCLTDVDEVENLFALREELLGINYPTAEQSAILEWLDRGCPACRSSS